MRNYLFHHFGLDFDVRFLINFCFSYDPIQGFTCFYDFVMGLEPTARMCNLTVGLYTSAAEFGKPTMLPTVYTERIDEVNSAVIGTKQPFPK